MRDADPCPRPRRASQRLAAGAGRTWVEVIHRPRRKRGLRPPRRGLVARILRPYDARRGAKRDRAGVYRRQSSRGGVVRDGGSVALVERPRPGGVVKKTTAGGTPAVRADRRATTSRGRARRSSCTAGGSPALPSLLGPPASRRLLIDGATPSRGSARSCCGRRAGSMDFRRTGSPTTSIIGKRLRISSQTTRSCISARRLPTQRWMPKPNDEVLARALAVDDEGFGVVDHRLVAVARDVPHDHLVALADGLAADLEVRRARCGACGRPASASG